MQSQHLKQVAALLAAGLVIWVLCGAVMYAGMALTPMNTAIIIHAIAAPIIAAAVAWVYFRRFHYTRPEVTAAYFTGLVIALDVVVVALLIEGSFAMFGNILGTWVPFALIFLATYVTGRGLEIAGKAALAS
jgi:hypothetical protein